MHEGPPIAVVAAVRVELAPLIHRLGLKRSGRGAGLRYAGSYGGRPIVAAVTGMGRRCAEAATAELLTEHRPDRVYVIGFAGGANPRLGAGDLVIPAEVVDGATDRRYRPTAAESETGGVLWTADRMVSEPGEKRRLFEERGADAVDMETAAVAAVCEQRGVAWGVVRAISDPAGEALPAFVEKLNRPDGRANGWAAVRSILRDPRRIGALARLGYRSRIAGRALSERVAALL